jgi:two-component system, sensor histidine kinase and response regulator
MRFGMERTLVTDVTNPGSVLVIDDDGMNRALAEVVLGSAGYAVTLAENGAAALASFAERLPDLVLLDVVMPVMDGFETCRRLRVLPNGADVPILFLTANSDLRAQQKALESGADDFLTKPLNRTELLIRVRSLIRIRRMHVQLLRNYQVIRTQNEALRRTQHQKQELTDLIVHDLKSPLTGIYTNAEFALSLPSLPEPARGALHDVVTGVQTMLRIVLNLLDVSRSEDGVLAPTFTEVDLVALVEQVRGTVRRRAEAEDRKFVVRSEPSSLLVRGDSDLLRRLLENLIDNSLNHAPPNTSVALDVTRAENTVRIAVRDEGEGVPMVHRERIFDKYAQVHRQGAAKIRSSRGLGLAFCRLAAEAHGGRIWVEDNAPTGSAFVVELPFDR